MTKDPESQLVYICGSGHSGSTLLDMMLGGHQQISSLGEIHRFYLSMNKDTPPHLCACGKKLMECAFWSKVLIELQSFLGLSDQDSLKSLVTTDPAYLKISDEIFAFREVEPVRPRNYSFSVNALAMIIGSKSAWRILSSHSAEVRLQHTIVRNSLAIYEAVRRAWRTPIIVDSTKNPNRMKALYLASQQPFRAIYLLRDGRAVCSSRMKRQKLPMETCARIWKAEHRKQWLAQLTIPHRLITKVCYEDLCGNPPKELEKICKVLGIDFQPSMLEFRNSRHNLGGNPMRWRPEETRIILDDKWRHELQTKDLLTFERIAGKLNRKLGYEQ
jgi:hypothetical protein